MTNLHSTSLILHLGLQHILHTMPRTNITLISHGALVNIGKFGTFKHLLLLLLDEELHWLEIRGFDNAVSSQIRKMHN